MKVEVGRYGGLYFDYVYVNRDDKERIKEFVNIGDPMHFYGACWRVSQDDIKEAMGYVARVAGVSKSSLSISRKKVK